MTRPHSSSAATRFAWSQVREFATANWGSMLWFAVLSLGRAATAVAIILLIRDFLTGVLGTPTGLPARLTAAVGLTAALWIVAGVLLAVFMLGAVCAYGSQLSQQRLVRRLELNLMRKLITHVLRLPVSFFNRHHRADLVESIRQDVSKTRGAVSAMADMAVFGLQAVAYAGSATLLSPRLVLTTLPVLVLAAVPGRWFTRRLRRRSFRARGHGYRLTDLLLQLLEGIRIVKVYQREEAEARNSIATAKRYFNEVLAAAKVKALGQVLVETAGSLSVVLVTIVGGFEVMNGRLSVASLVATLIAIRAAYGPLNNAVARFMELHWSWASIERLRQLLRTKPDVRDQPDAMRFEEPVRSIRFEHVSFGYTPEAPVLTDVSFDVHAGQHIGIVGPSGSGKTTMMSLVARFYDPTAGRVLLNGRDLRVYRQADVFERLALVTQDLFVFGTTLRENILYGAPDASDAQIEAAARAAEIHGDIVTWPEGYDTLLGVGGRLLSAGQIQRVNIARAFLKNAPVVILDEATSNLDSISEAKIQVALQRLMQGRTTFTVAHRLSTLRDADMILVMNRGRCIATGTHHSLIASCQLYRQLWESQQVGATPPSPTPAVETAL